MRGLNEGVEDGNPTAAAGTRRSARLRHRIPVRLRHYWKTLAVVCVGLLAVVLVFGEARVRPYITSALVSDDAVTENIEGTTDLFDGGEHTIEVSFNESEYADMMRTFREEGEKQFVRADITIDGTLVNDVGLRLKGNSTLMSLRAEGGMGGEMPGAGMPGGAEGAMPPGMPGTGGGGPPGGATDTEHGQGPPEGGDGGGAEEGGGGGPGMITLSEDEPESLPWLISFEEFYSGRAYQGHTEITLRPATTTSDTALNEALALDLTAADGQTTQDYTFTSFTVNDGASVPRLLLDAPDAAWAAEFGEGVLFKGRASGSFDYLGGDPTDYEEAFNQINGEGSHDLQPVMNLLEFVEKADDEEFARELDDYVDAESFARYLALQNLMSNSDGMDGPGNNYYLWYDTEEERFTVLSWDLNLSFGAMEGMLEGLGLAEDGEMPEGMEPPGGMQLPEGGELPEGLEDMGAMMRGSGALKDRFLENEDFTAMYEHAYAELYESLVESGTASELLYSAVSRAEAAGDEGASAAGEDLVEQVDSIADAPQEDMEIPGMGGRGQGEE